MLHEIDLNASIENPYSTTLISEQYGDGPNFDLTLLVTSKFIWQLEGRGTSGDGHVQLY